MIPWHASGMAGKIYAVSEATLKAVARDWFLRGFRCSGYGAHGETKLRHSRAFESLLEAEFERSWCQRRSPDPDTSVVNDPDVPRGRPTRELPPTVASQLAARARRTR